MTRKPILCLGATALLALLASTASAQVIARWSMDPNTGPLSGGNPQVLDVRTASGEGTEIGAFGFKAAPFDDLWFLSADMTPTPDVYPSSTEVPPASMFDNGYSGGAFSYDCGATVGLTNGGLFYPTDVDGNEFAFFTAFSVEMFFKTNGDQSGGGLMQLLLQGEGFFRYGLVVNEAGPGTVRFAINDGVGTFVLVTLGNQNYADGQWHYVLATYDPTVGVNGQVSLTISNEDGTTSSTTADVPVAFAGLPVEMDGTTMTNDGNLFIGLEQFDIAGDANGDGLRRVDGLIDEVQLTKGIVPSTDRLGRIDGPPPPTPNGVIARWSMSPAPGLPDPLGGANPVVLDSLDDASLEAGPDNLFTFNGLSGGGSLTEIFSADVPPASMFSAGNDAGSSSYDVHAFASVDGGIFYPQDVGGNEFSFEEAFAVELFFKTTSDSTGDQGGDQSGAGFMTLVLQGENAFRFGLILNEPNPGDLRFAISDGSGHFPVADATARNYADGSWHYVLAEYDPSVGSLGGLTLTVLSEDGSSDVTTVDIAGAEPAFLGLAPGNDGNMFLGFNQFPIGGPDPRKFRGLIDEIQLHRGPTVEGALLGALAAPPCPCTGDIDGDCDTDVFDFGAFAPNFGTFGHPPFTNGDLDGDGDVDVFDFAIFAPDFGCVGP